MKTVYRALAVVCFIAAFALWLLSPAPDCNYRVIGGCGLLDVGLGGLDSMLAWGLVSVVAAVGIWLWSKG